MKNFRYSPLPISAYILTKIDGCEVTTIMGLGETESMQDLSNAERKSYISAIWNLFWLSLPAVDALPVHGKTDAWFRHYVPTTGAMAAVIHDALGDPAMLHKLMMNPGSFADFFERQEHKKYNCYLALGEKFWVKTVIQRARESQARLTPAPAPAPDSSSAGNVLTFPGGVRA